MKFKMGDKYLDALEQIAEWTTVSEWAEKFGELYPDLLEKAEKEAKKHKRPSTGLREIAARISSRLARGAFVDHVEVDNSERPKKVRYLTTEQANQRIQREIDEDLEPIKRREKMKLEFDALSKEDRYRHEEFSAIAASLNSMFNLDFEVDHANAISNPDAPGKNHPDNLQILQKSHNRRKNDSNWKRFTIEEQIAYIQAAVKVQHLIAKQGAVPRLVEI